MRGARGGGAERRLFRPGRALAALLLLAGAAAQAAAEGARLEVDVLYLARRPAAQAERPEIDPPPDDAGIAGARLGLEDNAADGRAAGEAHSLETVSAAEGAPLMILARAALAQGPRLIVADLPMADLLAVADLPEARDALILNVGAPDDALRDAECRANLLHVAPSRAMLTDALAQFLAARDWRDWSLIEGGRTGDAALADAHRRSAAKFGARIVARSVVRPGDEAAPTGGAAPPRFAPGPDHDVAVVADETGDLARRVPFATARPRPVAGSAGLRPTAWSPAVETRAEARLQPRFRAFAGRDMGAGDWIAWAAMRTVAEAARRAGAADPAALRARMLSADFSVAIGKPGPASFRAWNGQMRQSVPLIHDGTLVATAPPEGAGRAALDALGLDAPDSACAVFPRDGG